MGSITIGSITFTWTGTNTTGTFVDGQYWILVPSGTISMNEPTPAQGTYNGYQTNGAELNPIYSNAQGFSDMHNTFDGGRTQTSWPVNMSAGDILLKSVSDVGWSTLDDNRIRAGMYTEFAAVYIVDTVPDSEAFAPAAIGWTGRGTPTPISIDTNQWADLDAIVATLPSYALGSFSAEVPSVAQVFDNAIDKFNVGLAIQKGAGSLGGYQACTVRDFTESGFSNYGPYQNRVYAGSGLHLIGDTASTAKKKEILIRLISHGIQMYDPHRGSLTYVGGNGAHHQYHHIAVAMYLHYTGQNVDDMTTYLPGNLLGQIFVPTQADIDSGILQPHTDNAKPACSHIRAITAVSGNNLTLASTGSDGAVVWLDGTVLRRVSDGATAYVQSATTGLDATIDAQPSPAFTTSDTVTIEPYGGWVAGYTGVQWLISTQDVSRDLSTLVLGTSANYRSLTEWAGQILVLKGLGIKPVDIDAVDYYVTQTNLADYPPSNDYFDNFYRNAGSLDFAESFWNAHYSSMSWPADAPATPNRKNITLPGNTPLIINGKFVYVS